MKKIYIISLTLLVWLSFNIIEVTSETTNPTLATTGAPGETDCTACHGGQPNTGLATTMLTVGLDGNLYGNDPSDGANKIDFTMSSSGKRKFGFEMTMLDKNNKQCGFFRTPNTFVDSGYSTTNKRYYSFQNGTNGSVFGNVGAAQWTAMWQCPPNYTDPVYLYTSFLETNEDGTTDGDRTYTRRDTFFCEPLLALALAKKNPISFNAFVTANNKIQVVFEPTKTTNVLVDLYNIDGQKVQNIMNKELGAGATEQTLDMPAHIAAGLYLISCESNGTRVVKKIFIN